MDISYDRCITNSSDGATARTPLAKTRDLETIDEGTSLSSVPDSSSAKANDVRELPPSRDPDLISESSSSKGGSSQEPGSKRKTVAPGVPGTTDKTNPDGKDAREPLEPIGSEPAPIAVGVTPPCRHGLGVSTDEKRPTQRKKKKGCSKAEANDGQVEDKASQPTSRSADAVAGDLRTASSAAATKVTDRPPNVTRSSINHTGMVYGVC